MRYVLFCISILILILSNLLFGCKKEEHKEAIAPSIRFVTESGFVFKDTLLKTADKFRIGIICKAGTYNITHYNYTFSNEKGKNAIDSGMNSTGFRWETALSKGSSKAETWSFYVRDREGNASDTIHITIKLDSNSVYGKIISVPEIILGAQDNTVDPEFYSLTTKQTYNAAKAYQNQNLIDLVYYYDPITGDNNSIASPGANIDSTLFTGSNAIKSWLIKNTTRFEYTTLTGTDFNASNNDSLILANTFPFASGKRKAKNLVAGNIYSFVTQNSQKGLFMVNNVSGTNAGSIKISLKIQDQ